MPTNAELHNEIRGLKSLIDSLSEKLKERDEDTDRIKRLEHDVEILKSQNSKLQKQNNELFEKTIALDSYGRKDNLIFEGVNVNGGNDCWSKVKEVMTTNLKLPADYVNSIKIQRCHKLPSSQKTRIIVRFLWFHDREKVWNARRNLAGSNIFLNEDFAMEIAKRRKSLFPIMKKARSSNKKAFLKADKLIIDGTSYSVNTLKDLPPDLDPAEAATKRFPEITAFFSSATPLSNFYQTNIMIDNHSYHSVEQYFQLEKAKFAEDLSAVSQIRKATHPAECKKIGDKVKLNFQNWLPKAKTVLMKGCRAKFTQDERAKAFLLGTGDTTLAEATHNKTWGVGLPLNDKDLEIKEKWTGQNVVGIILTDLRNEMKL